MLLPVAIGKQGYKNITIGFERSFVCYLPLELNYYNTTVLIYSKFCAMKKMTILFSLMLFLSKAVFCQLTITGFFSENTNAQIELEKKFDKHLDKENIGSAIKYLSSRPHHLGSPAGKESAEYIRDRFKSYGWDAEIETFYVLFPSPKERVLELVSPSRFKANLNEPAVAGDPTSGQKDRLPPYNAFSADGDVTAELVFVNYGLPSDYEVLARMGIDVKGKIVIAKYGRSWRGTKPKVAQEHGAVGCIIYSDPIDDGYMAGDVYPKGPYKNEWAVQRGSVMDIVIHPGDPLTPDIGATKDARRIDRKDAETILKIPVLPIGYHDAEPLLKALSGRTVPREWQGGLPFAYHTGPGADVVKLKTIFNWDIVPCYNVIARVTGSEFPDEWIIRGNHHDAWVHGAADPVSGLAAMMEEAKSIGELMRTGWKPKRTLVYCAWDGEEQGLLGSTEWAEHHQKELQQKAVVYINSDNNGRGFLYASGSHALEPFMTEISKSVTDPQTQITVFERLNAFRAVNSSNPTQKIAAIKNNKLVLGALGSGSDYSTFIQHLGIPALNLGFGGEDRGGEYHTNYDSYSNFIRFKDPGFFYAKALSEVAGRTVLRMANADILPFRFSHLTNTIDTYKNEVMNLIEAKRLESNTENSIISGDAYKHAWDQKENFILPEATPAVPYLDFSALENSLQRLKMVTEKLEDYYTERIQNGKPVHSFNQKLYQAEQRLLGQGLPMRPWYKHVIYAPGYYTGYGVKTMPGIREAIEEKKWDQAQDQIRVTAAVINQFTDYLQQAMQGN